ncbi:MAG: FAD-dependent oxidoreductase [Bacteroidales bacterium]|nr:FAD-dependent oxidoreductase [Bacteroidales bacterium]
MNTKHFDIIIVGGGPAGLTAGIYAARSKAKVLILDEGIVGGQTILTHKVENYPGIEQISGYGMASIMKSQAENFGCEIVSNTKIIALDLTSELKSIETANDHFTADSIIIATGGRSKSLNVGGEDALKGRGISYCATCDGDFFQDKEIIVVGGGNTALEEAVSLTKYASKVTVVHVLDQWQAFDHAVNDAKENKKIEFVMESKIVQFHGDESLRKVTVEHLPTGKRTDVAVEGCFIFIGYDPNTSFLENTGLELNTRKEIISNELMQTNIEGVFVAGDSRNKKYRQITTAVNDGTIAALEAVNYVFEKRKQNQLQSV